MKTFRVTLHRDYFVEINAKDETEAKGFTEYFLSSPIDDSTNKEKEKYGFGFGTIEMVTNEATEVEEIKDGVDETI